MKYSFPASYRLKTKADFSALRRANRLSSGNISLVYRANQHGHARLALAVSRKYGNAVQRNRFKRIFRETLRTSRLRDCAVDVLVIPRSSALHMMDISSQAMQAFDMLYNRMQSNRT